MRKKNSSYLIKQAKVHLIKDCIVFMLTKISHFLSTHPLMNYTLLDRERASWKEYSRKCKKKKKMPSIHPPYIKTAPIIIVTKKKECIWC